MNIDSNPLNSLLALARPVVVLTPPQVSQQASMMRQDARIMNGYALGLVLPEAVVKTLERRGEQHGIRLTVYPSPRGVAVLCATLQVGGSQLRTVCNANDGGTRNWLSSLLVSERANWLIDIEGGKQTTWVSHALTIPDPFELLLALQRSVRLDASGEAVECAIVGMSLAEPKEVPSLIPGCRVNTMVLAIQPPGTLGQTASSTQETSTLH